MPLYTSENKIVITAKTLFAIFIIVLIVGGILAFLNDYHALAFLCLSLAGIIGFFWLFLLSGWYGWLVALGICAFVFLIVLWRYAQPEWQELTGLLTLTTCNLDILML